MGLNPPFGVKASLANKFIDKALLFKPKLIVLIVPKETKRYELYSCQQKCLFYKIRVSMSLHPFFYSRNFGFICTFILWIYPG
jgi:hypothetical protein